MPRQPIPPPLPHFIFFKYKTFTACVTATQTPCKVTQTPCKGLMKPLKKIKARLKTDCHVSRLTFITFLSSLHRLKQGHLVSADKRQGISLFVSSSSSGWGRKNENCYEYSKYKKVYASKCLCSNSVWNQQEQQLPSPEFRSNT